MFYRQLVRKMILSNGIHVAHVRVDGIIVEGRAQLLDSRWTRNRYMDAPFMRRIPGDRWRYPGVPMVLRVAESLNSVCVDASRERRRFLAD